jgi:hypothetical protein
MADLELNKYFHKLTADETLKTLKVELNKYNKSITK